MLDRLLPWLSLHPCCADLGGLCFAKVTVTSFIGRKRVVMNVALHRVVGKCISIRLDRETDRLWFQVLREGLDIAIFPFYVSHRSGSQSSKIGRLGPLCL